MIIFLGTFITGRIKDSYEFILIFVGTLFSPPFSLGKLFYSIEHFMPIKFNEHLTNVVIHISIILFPEIYKNNLKQTHP